MDFNQNNQERFILHLRRALPLPAHPRTALLAFLRERGVIARGAPRLIVLDVFDAGGSSGLMCRFAVAEHGDGATFIAPFAQVALARRHPARLRVVRRRQTPPPGAA
ncbi:MAG: hypothetical protein ACR65Z_05475 [Methylocystis sp.]|jgi:hypothetical protein